MTRGTPTRSLPRWRRILRKSALVLLSMVALYVAAGLLFDALILLELRRIRQEGAPTCAAELASPMPPDSQNAAPLYRKAFRLIPHRRSPSALGKLEFWDEQPNIHPKPELLAEARKESAALEPIRGLLRQAAARPQCRYRKDWETGCNPDGPVVPRLARKLVVSAVARASDGDADGALEDLRLAVQTAGSADNQGYIAVSERTVVVMLSNRLLLEMTKAGLPDQEELQSLWSSLAWSTVEDGIVPMLKYERAFGITRFNQLAQGQRGLKRYFWYADTIPTWYRFECSWFGRPILLGDELAYLRAMHRVISRAHTLTCRLRKPPLSGPCEHADSSLWFSAQDPFVEHYGWRRGFDLKKAQTNGCRTATALCIYRKRFGAYPKELADLRRLKLKLDTQDPFSGRDFVYKRQARGFILYSVGPDLRDDKAIHDYPEVVCGRSDIVWRVTQ